VPTAAWIWRHIDEVLLRQERQRARPQNRAEALEVGRRFGAFSVTPVYILEGGENCTYNGNCSPLGDFYFGGGGDWLVVVAFALLGAIIWGLLRRRVAGKFP
jgi:hypothetical protein